MFMLPGCPLFWLQVPQSKKVRERCDATAQHVVITSERQMCESSTVQRTLNQAESLNIPFN